MKSWYDPADFMKNLGAWILQKLDNLIPPEFKRDGHSIELIRARLLVSASFFIFLIGPNLVRQIIKGLPLTDPLILGPFAYLMSFLSIPFVLWLTRSIFWPSLIIPFSCLIGFPFIMMNDNGLVSHPAYMTTLATGLVCLFTGPKIGLAFFTLLCIEIVAMCWGHLNGYFGGVRDLDILAITNNLVVSNLGTFLLFGVFVGVHRNIHGSLRSRESELDSAQTSLINSARLASIGEMSGGIAHEINNPLAIIRGYVQRIASLSRKGELTPEIACEIAKKTSLTVDRIHSVVEGLRKISRDDKMEDLKSIIIVDLVDEAIALCKEKLKIQGGSIEKFIDPKLQVHCQNVQICQVLVNLLNNSIHAISDVEEKWIRIEALILTSGKVQIRLTDSGRGIDPAIKEKLFVPFFSTKPAGVGTGLGLSISRQILRNHCGELFLDKNIQNTCFVIELPGATRSKPLDNELMT